MSNAFRVPLRAVRRELRPALALAFALLVWLAPLAAVSRAQGTPKPGGPQFTLSEHTPTYIIYQTPGGETGCRVATPAEVEELRRGPDAGLRQINHLKHEGSLDAVSAGLTIILRGTAQLEANPAAKQAFINAAAKWEALISNQITVVIDVDYGPNNFGTPYPSPNILGSTSTSGFVSSYSTVRQRLVNRAPVGSEESLILNTLPLTGLPTDIGTISQVFMPPPIMRALGLLGPTPDTDTQSVPVPRIGFNSAFAFDFNPEDGVAFNQTDFDSVAVHEIGHALGFNSEAGSRELSPTRTLMATIWDFYRFKPGVGTAATFPVAARTLSSGTSPADRHVHFSGGAEIDLSTGKPDGTGGDGEQASHWKDDAQGVPHIGIMDPTLPRGRHEVITANDLKAIDLFGYSVGTVSAPTAPANDNFSAAQPLAGLAGIAAGANSGATKEAGEPSHSPDSNPGGKSVWYAWQAPAGGPVTFTTGQGALGGPSSFDTLLAVYTGTNVAALAPVAKNDDAPSGGVTTSFVQFTATAGTTYMIAVDGWNADEGSVALSWNLSATPITVQFAASAITTGEGAGSVAVNVTRTGGTGPFAVNYATSDGTAVSGADYQATGGVLSFGAGETSKSFSVSLLNDITDENNETVNLSLSGPTSGALLGAPSAAVLTIVDEDQPPTVSVASMTLVEGNTGTGTVFFPVNLSNASALPVSVNYATANGSAAAGSDYVAVSGTLSFAPGETSKTVTLGIVGDTAAEPESETFFFDLSGATNATIFNGRATVTIRDNDTSTPPRGSVIRFGAATFSTSEGNPAAVLTVTRADNLDLAASVTVRTVDNPAAVACRDTTTLPGVAFARCDYATTVETITFAPNEVSKTFSVPLVDDAHGEPDESVQLVLSATSPHSVIGAQSSATLVINSNEPPGQSGAANPIDSNRFFVRMHYLDFLSREPEAGEPWTGVLDRCPNVNNDPNCDRVLVSSAFFRSQEFELKGRYVFRFYKVSLGRLPEYAEIVTDMRSVTGATGAEVLALRASFASAWVNRADFRAAFDAVSNDQFVNTLMGRYGLLAVTTFHPATPEGGNKVLLSRTGMTTALNTGQWTRAQVLRAIADSDEVGRAEFNPSFVAMQYYGYLRRTPEPAGFIAWLNYLNANPTDFRTMVNGFVNSGEYRLRFGTQ